MGHRCPGKIIDLRRHSLWPDALSMPFSPVWEHIRGLAKWSEFS